MTGLWLNLTAICMVRHHAGLLIPRPSTISKVINFPPYHLTFYLLLVMDHYGLGRHLLTLWHFISQYRAVLATYYWQLYYYDFLIVSGSSNTITDTTKLVMLLSADLKRQNWVFVLLFGKIFVNDPCPQTEQNSLVITLGVLIMLIIMISQTCISSWTGGIHQPETSNLWQVNAVKRAWWIWLCATHKTK